MFHVARYIEAGPTHSEGTEPWQGNYKALHTYWGRIKVPKIIEGVQDILVYYASIITQFLVEAVQYIWHQNKAKT